MSPPRDFRDSSARWEFERKLGCEHKWQPVSLELQPGGISAPGSRCYVVCLDCGGISYAETWWVGHRLDTKADAARQPKGET
jgi:hypothetical protein